MSEVVSLNVNSTSADVAEIVIRISPSTMVLDCSVKIKFKGIPLEGIDFEAIDNVIVFQPGEFEKKIYIKPIWIPQAKLPKLLYVTLTDPVNCELSDTENEVLINLVPAVANGTKMSELPFGYGTADLNWTIIIQNGVTKRVSMRTLLNSLPQRNYLKSIALDVSYDNQVDFVLDGDVIDVESVYINGSQVNFTFVKPILAVLPESYELETSDRVVVVYSTVPQG